MTVNTTGISSDGRHRRSEKSRAKIVDSMLILVKEGNVAPTAEEVAARAGIGLRSVFRHFSDMETLRREMFGQFAIQYGKWLEPLKATDWRSQLDELIDRRANGYEEMMPFKRAADAYRYRSRTIGEEYNRILAFMRMRLHSSLPPAIQNDAVTFEALDSLLSYEFWQRLRGDQKLSFEDARKVIGLLLTPLITAVNISTD